MNDNQMYVAVGVPLILGLLNLGATLGLFIHLSGRVDALSARMDRLQESVNVRIDLLIGKIHELELRIK